MAEYVNKAELEKFKRLSVVTYEGGKKENKAVIVIGCEIFNELPTIDIVHCEMCKYWSLEKELTKLNGERYTVGYCCLDDKYSDSNWFCADGERKPALKHADKETLQSAT